jgi:hypothetical protein
MPAAKPTKRAAPAVKAKKSPAKTVTGPMTPPKSYNPVSPERVREILRRLDARYG